MSGALVSDAARAILFIVLLIASPMLSDDRALAQEGETSHKAGHAQSESLAQEVQKLALEQNRTTVETLFKEARERASSACSHKDLEGVVEKYQELLRILDADTSRRSVAEICLELGKFKLYLAKYDEADAFLDRALKSFTSEGDRTGKAKVLAIQVVLSVQKNELKNAIDLLEQVPRAWGNNSDFRSQAEWLRYLATITQEFSDFQQAIDCSENRNERSRQTDETTGQIRFMSQIGNFLRANGMHEKAEQVGEQSLAVSRGLEDKRWEASALEDLANVYKDRGQYDRAFIRYLKALKIYEMLEDGPKQTELMNNLGRVLLVQGKNQEAKSSHEKALTIARATGNLKGSAVSLGGLGSVYQSIGEYANAAECHEQSLVIFRKIGDARAESYALDLLGNVHLTRGEYVKASDCYEKSLEIRRKIGHPKGEAASLNKLGALYLSWGQPAKARKYLELSLEITRKIGDIRGDGASFNKLGEVYQAFAQYDKAMEYFEKSLEITRKIGDVRGEAAGLRNQGKVHRSWGQYDKALECFKKSLEITRKIGDAKGEASSLTNLGRVYQFWGQHDHAMQCNEKSLEITRKIGDVEGQAASLRSMGIVSVALRKHEEAVQYYEQVLEIENKLGVSTSLTSALLAQLYMDMGDLQRAEVFVQKAQKPIPAGRLLLLKTDFSGARKIFQELLKKAEEEQHWTSLFVSCTGLGMALEGLGDYTAAAENYKRAIKLAEKERDRLSSGDRDSYFDVKVRGMSRTAPYEGMARVLIMMNQQASAFRISELSKARAFAEAIARKPSNMPINVPSDVVEKSRQLADRISELESKREKAVQYGDRELLEYMESQISQIEGEIRAYRKSLREKFPVYAATMYPTRSLPLKDSAVRESEWILSYDTTDSGLLIYLVHGKQLVRGILKPIRKTDVEDLVRKFRTPLVLESSDNYRQRLEKLRSFDFSYGNKLANLLLGDILPDLPVSEPVIIIPDDSLADLPFEMLVLNQGGRIEEKDSIPCTVDAHFFGDRNPVSYYQSVTALTLARTFGTKQIHGSKLLVIADPVTDPYDERITPDAVAKVATVTETPSKNTEIALLNGRSGLPLARLIQTKDLVEHLARINSSSEMLTGFDASKQKFLGEVGPRLSEFKHIVFATHGSYGSDEGAISEPVLYLTLIPQGTDGVLRMSEVMGLKLNADLVALTACQSGLGKKVPGEGIMGMGRAFQYAGARSVLMSLWSVQATAATKLVETFYRKHMEGKDKLEALTLARNEIRKNGFDHPFFWAGLILAGETN
jgi:tetratricopeptide (TPR) repeat protein